METRAAPEPPPLPTLQGQVAPRPGLSALWVPTVLPTPQHQNQWETLWFCAFNLLRPWQQSLQPLRQRLPEKSKEIFYAPNTVPKGKRGKSGSAGEWDRTWHPHCLPMRGFWHQEWQLGGKSVLSNTLNQKGFVRFLPFPGDLQGVVPDLPHNYSWHQKHIPEIRLNCSRNSSWRRACASYYILLEKAIIIPIFWNAEMPLTERWETAHNQVLVEAGRGPIPNLFWIQICII